MSRSNLVHKVEAKSYSLCPLNEVEAMNSLTSSIGIFYAKQWLGFYFVIYKSLREVGARNTSTSSSSMGSNKQGLAYLAVFNLLGEVEAGEFPDAAVGEQNGLRVDVAVNELLRAVQVTERLGYLKNIEARVFSHSFLINI